MLIEELKKYEKFKHLVVDRNEAMNSLGMDIQNHEFVDLNKIPLEELNDLIVKSLMWIETINEKLYTAVKYKLDAEIERDKYIANGVKILLDSGSKTNDAKSQVKGTVEYVEAHKKLNTLEAYCEYLKSLVENIQRYHYVIKSRIDSMKSIQSKYGGL